jgi:hypothetical protein
MLIGLALVASSTSPLSTHAQRTTGRVGIGAQVGRPSGLTGKLYRHAQLAYDLSLVWNLRDFVFVESHRMHEWPIPNSPLHLLLGPGVFAGLDEAPRDNEVTLGISGALGLNFFRERFEVFLQAMPRMRLYPATQARLGGSVGLRYFF